jgi:hypothetical protein
MDWARAGRKDHEENGHYLLSHNQKGSWNGPSARTLYLFLDHLQKPQRSPHIATMIMKLKTSVEDTLVFFSC